MFAVIHSRPHAGGLPDTTGAADPTPFAVPVTAKVIHHTMFEEFS